MKRRRGKGFFDDMASGLIHVGIPTLGRIAGTVLGGPAGAMVGETLGEAGAEAIGRATDRVKNHGYHSRQRGKSGLHIQGGSFLAL